MFIDQKLKVEIINQIIKGQNFAKAVTEDIKTANKNFNDIGSRIQRLEKQVTDLTDTLKSNFFDNVKTRELYNSQNYDLKLLQANYSELLKAFQKINPLVNPISNLESEKFSS